MTITSIKGTWYDSNGERITEEAKNKIRDQINSKLDRELLNTGFQGLIKKIIKKQMNK